MNIIISVGELLDMLTAIEGCSYEDCHGSKRVIRGRKVMGLLLCKEGSPKGPTNLDQSWNEIQEATVGEIRYFDPTRL